ncbi:MAG: 30S ribosome-binding factor RbfA [Planctomycetota bacterium]|jgi:ribosome-binding factor A
MKSYRPERVANVIRSVVSDAIVTKLSDPRIQPMTSVTRVEVSGDLEYAKIWVSVMGTSAAQRRTIEGLQSARGYVQGLLARRLPIRQCPRIVFHLDESIKRAAETIRMIDEAMSELDTDADRFSDQQDTV